MEILSGQAAVEAEAFFRGGSPPRVLQQRIVTFLERAANGRHALERMRFENHLLDEAEAEIDGQDVRVFKLQHIADVQRSSLTTLENEIARGRKVDNQLAAAKHEFADTTARIASMTAKRNALQAQARPLVQRQQSCTKLLLQGIAGTKLEFLDRPAVNPKTTLDKVRDRITELQAKLVDVQNAPVPSKIAIEQMKGFIKRSVAPINARTLLDGRHDADRRPWIPRMILPSSGGAAEAPNFFGVICWMFGDQMVSLLEDQIRMAARDDEAIAPDLKNKKETEIEAEITETERLEETIVWNLLLKEGKNVTLRGEASPNAILWVRRIK